MRPLISLIFLLSIFIISPVNSGLTEEQRKSLLKKVTKQVSFKHKKEPLNQYFPREGQTGMTYEASKIKQIITKYGFPESYNYITEKSPNVHIKNQGNCGSCWAFASTTALAYRFHNKGINVDLSPQHGISCYISDCDVGDYLINSQFNLVKNGTVTEECLPYASGNGRNRESCPAKCKNGDDLVLYYAKNAYTTEEDYSQENFYDIVTVIIDQLITYGPVESGFSVYSDFYNLRSNSNCKNTIYKLSENAEQQGGHAVVIVGYGVQNNRYYWIAQNSWGSNFCDGGFFKVEFGQVNIEQVSFAEAYVDDNSAGKQININVNEVGKDCKVKFSTTDDMNGVFEMYYYQDSKYFYFQCGPIYLSAKEGICSFNVDSVSKAKGTFKYREHHTLLNKDTYNLNFATSSNEFYFYGADFIDSPYVGGNNYYISQNVKSFTLYFNEPLSETNTNTFLGKIYFNKDTTTALNDCKLIKLDEYFSIIYCTLTSDEIENLPESNNSPLTYDILCGSREIMDATLNKFNSGSYPIFRITEFTLPKEKIATADSAFVLSADIEGSLSGFTTDDLAFGVFARIETGEKDYYEILICYNDSPSKLGKDFLIPCYLDIDSGYSYSYNNVYLTPYIVPVEDSKPFQVIIEKELKGNEYDDADEEIQRFSGSDFLKFINSSLLILIVMYLLFTI